MASLRSEFELAIEGKQYKCTLDLEAMIRLEEHFSTPTHPVTFQEVVALVQGQSIRHTRAFFWSALQRHHPDITLEQAGDLMLKAIGGFEGAIRAAIESASADPQDLAVLGIDKVRPRKAQAKRVDGTGVNSGSKHAASV